MQLNLRIFKTQLRNKLKYQKWTLPPPPTSTPEVYYIIYKFSVTILLHLYKLYLYIYIHVYCFNVIFCCTCIYLYLKCKTNNSCIRTKFFFKRNFISTQLLFMFYTLNTCIYMCVYIYMVRIYLDEDFIL